MMMKPQVEELPLGFRPVRQYSSERRKPRVQSVPEGESLTVQYEASQTEILHILAKYRETGIIDHMRNVDLQFRDVSQFEDFSDMMRQTKEAEKAFMRLPSKVREVFHHDVMEWLDAAHDPEKLEALRPKFEELGVWEKAAAPVAAPAVPAPIPAP